MKTSFWRRWWPWARAAGHGRPALRGRPERRRLELEPLEERTLPSGAQLLADINPGAASSNPSQMVAIGSTTFFAANDGTHGNELWKTDGTPAGTVLVADINPGSAGSNPSDLTSLNGQLYFAANDGVHGTELWKSDGTAAGTVMVADIDPGSGGSYPGYLTNVNGELFFRANDGTHGLQLWKSDGTAAGTARVSDINPGGNGFSDISNITNVNGEFFFVADDGTNGQALWKSDGTAAGTVMVLAVSYSNGYGYSQNYDPGNLTNVNGTLFFTDGDGAWDAPQLWKSDGTTAGTTLVEDFGPNANTSDLTNVNGTLYFAAFGDLSETQLWKSDGTAGGTVMVSDINPRGNGLYDFSDLTNVNGELFFAANDGTHGTELWKSDRTAAGTVLVKDINPGSAGSDPQYLTNVNGELFFAANDGTHGTELWESDGNAAGTVLVADINPGSASSSPSSLTNMNGMLLFAANDGVHGNELWQAPVGPSLALSAASTPTAGVADTFTITALNADGTPDTTLDGAVSIAVSDARAVYPTSVTLTNGTAQFNVTFETAGPQAVTATDVQTPTDNGSSGIVNIQPAAASKFTLTGFPAQTAVGTPGSFTVTAYDPYGNVATEYSGTVHFSSSDPNAILPLDSTLINGAGQFTATLETVGTGESLTATDTRNGTLTVTQAGIEVLPYASISGPSGGAIGETLTYTLGAGADPVGTLFSVNWGDGTSTQTTATTVTHTYTGSGSYNLSVTATANGLTSNPATGIVGIAPVTVTVEGDPAQPGAEMLVVALSSINGDDLSVGGSSSSVSLAYNGNPLANVLPTNSETFALVEVFALDSSDTLDARKLSVSSVLVGGAGSNVLYGGSGRNLLIAGLGSGSLYAGTAGDILIGGSTSYDSDTLGDQKALAYLMAEWDSADSYATRIKKLQNGGGLNGSYVLNSTTVFDNGLTNYLYGYSLATGAGLDWFFAHHARRNGDQVYNQVSGEVVTKI
jgi:ELWxxDGT repeat protein